jgi:hypothetical protein
MWRRGKTKTWPEPYGKAFKIKKLNGVIVMMPEDSLTPSESKSQKTHSLEEPSRSDDVAS